MAEKYEDESEEVMEENFDFAEEATGGGSGVSIWKLLLIFGVVGGLGYQFYKITELSDQLKSTKQELTGATQNLTEQKTKLSTKNQAVGDLEGKIGKYESEISEYKKKLAELESRANNLSNQISSQTSSKDTEIQAANEKVKALESSMNELNAQMALLKVEDLRVVTLKGGKKFSKGFAKMIWSQKQGTIFLNIINLVKPPEGQEFQLSANEGDHFFKVGTFTIDNSQNVWVKIPTVEFLGKKKVSDFVVTLEKKGGSDKITRPFYLTGSLGP